MGCGVGVGVVKLNFMDRYGKLFFLSSNCGVGDGGWCVSEGWGGWCEVIVGDGVLGWWFAIGIIIFKLY